MICLKLFFEENDCISKISEDLIANLKKKQDVATITQKIYNYYIMLLETGKGDYKNWIKILKRFYTLFTYAKSDLLLPKIKDHIIQYPILFSDIKIGKYLIRNKDNKSSLKKTLIFLIDYLYSEENLYPALESNLLETLLMLNVASLDNEVKKKLRKLCKDIFFKRNNYNPLSDYARGLACLMFYLLNKEVIKEIANHYLEYPERDSLLKKYMIFVSLTTENKDLRKKVLNKAKTEDNQSVTRLINFIENIDEYERTVNSFLKRDKIYIYSDQGSDFKIIEDFKPVRSEILENLLQIYSKH